MPVEECPRVTKRLSPSNSCFIMASYEYSDPVLDFDDANDFLLMLSSTLPSLDRAPKWDSNRLVFDPMDPVNPADSMAAFGDVNLSLPPDMILTQSEFAGLEALSVRRELSLRLGSYSDLAASQFAASADATPNTSISLPHTLPSHNLMDKNNLALPYYPDLFATTVLANASSAESETDSAEPEVVSPKLKIISKDKVTKPAKKAKVSHNMIEKKYRTNINSKILELRDAVPTLRIATGKANVLVAELEGLLPALKLNKASVLTKATEYIKHLERKNETMRSQISQLQALIHDTTMNPPVPRDMQMAPSTSTGFDFGPQSFDGLNDYNMYNSAPMANIPSQNNHMNPNMMLGGVATVMGSSMISGENFRGLAAVPFMPSFLTSPSALTIQLLSAIRTAVFVTGLLLIVSPMLQSLRRSEKSAPTSTWTAWVLVSLGFQLPGPLNPQAKEAAIAHLLGKKPSTSFDLVQDYITLNSSEVNFENSVLCLFVGALLVKRFPFAAKGLRLNMRWRASLLMNLDYTGDDAYLKKLNTLIKKLDGLSMFNSDRMVSRLNNSVLNRPINEGINNGENYLNFVELYMRNKDSIYKVLFNWRVLEIVHELNLTYLDVLAEESERREVSIEDIKNDVKKIDALLDDDDGLLVQYFTLFKCILFPESTPELISSVKRDIVDKLTKVSAIVDGVDLTDEEEILDDDESSSETEEVGSTVVSGVSTVDKFDSAVSEHKSMIYSLNLMNEEKFIVITSSLITYFAEKEDHAKALELLQYLKFKTGKFPLSLLSFTCFVKLLCTVVKPVQEDEPQEEVAVDVSAGNSVVLDSLVRLTRSWLNDDNKKNFMTHKLRGELCDLVVAKGMALNDL